jgi:ABC-2 type transport system permease protein
LNSVARLVARDMRVINRGLLVIQFLLPLFLLFVASFPLTALISPFQVDGQLISYQRFMAAGLIAQTTMTGSLVGGTLLFTDRRHGMFEQIVAGPFSRSAYAAGKMFSSMIIGLVGATIVTIFGLPFTYGVGVTPLAVTECVAAVLLGAMLFSGLSIILASLFKSLEAFEGTFNLLLILLTFVSSVLYPLSSVPSTLRSLMLLNPLTYEVDVVRSGLLGIGTPLVGWEGAALAAESAVMFVLALVSIRRVKVGAV